MPHSTKREQTAREDMAIYQAKMDKIDAEHLHQTVEALVTVNPTIARELIKNPAPILPLVENSGYTACLYALHALMVPLMGVNYTDILNEMSDTNIEILKKCISVARNHEQPEAESLNAEIARRTKEQETGKVKIDKDTTRPLTPEERKTNARMLTSFKVTAQFTDNSVWPEVCAELQKWSDAIDGFVRVKKVNVTAPKKSEPKQDKEPKDTDGETLWTINQLVDELNRAGLVADNKKVYNHRANILTNDPNSQAAKDISAWFTQVGRTLLFKARFFEEYKKLFAQIGRRGQHKNTAKPAPVETNAQPKDAKQVTLLDIKGQDALLTFIIKVCEQATKDLEVATQKRQSIKQQIVEETDDEKLDSLTDKLKEINAQVMQHKSTVAEFSKAKILADKKKKALEAKTVAEQALRDAEAEYNNVISTIDDFIKSAQSNTK